MPLLHASFLRFVLLLLALAALTGCSFVGHGLDTVGTGFHRTARAVRSF